MDVSLPVSDNGVMPLSAQAGYSDSVLCKFLDARLPRRGAVAEAWAQRAGESSGSAIEIYQEHRQKLGSTIETRIGLDLASSPGYWDILAFLPPDDCRSLLSEAGYSTGGNEHIADTGTTDPFLREWSRTWNPVAFDEGQRISLALCWDAVGMRDTTRGSQFRAELCRSMLVHLREDLRIRPPETVANALELLWKGYLQEGRKQTAALGDRVILEPEFAYGFGRGDMIVGRSLIDIKTSTVPSRYSEKWLNQVLGYALLDWLDIFCLDTVGVYLSWQALLINVPITVILAASSTGPTPSLADLRAEFKTLAQTEVDEEFAARMRLRYPPPLRA